MARPLIDFVHADELPWLDAALPGGSGPVRVRQLSHDPAMDELSLVVALPPGWRRPAGFVDHDEELFVLSGELEDAGDRLTTYSYVFRSAGRPRSGAHTEAGCTLLAFVRSNATFVAADGAEPEHDPSRDVAHVNLTRMEWERPKTPNFPPGAARKTLRASAVDGSGLWVIGLLPHWVSGFTEWHSVEEENYILEGEIQTTEGCMTRGSYLAHPAYAVHGPMHSLRGALAITRAAGPFQTTYERVPGYELPPPS